MKRFLITLVAAVALTCALHPLSAQQAGGAFIPSFNYDISGAWNFSGTIPTLTGNGSVVGTTATQTLTAKSLTTPVIDGVTYSAANDKQQIVTTVTLSGATIHAGVFTAWTAPAAAIVDRLEMNITTASTGASTLDCGYTAVSATTSSDTMLDGVSGTPAALFDSMNAALDSGANAKAQLAASAKWITCAEASGDVTGLVGKLYVYYHTL